MRSTQFVGLIKIIYDGRKSGSLQSVPLFCNTPNNLKNDPLLCNLPEIFLAYYNESVQYTPSQIR